MTTTKPFSLIPTWQGGVERVDHGQNFTARKTIFSGRTRFQDVAIIDSHEFGKILLVDGCCQSTQMDEYIYHESLVHPALTALQRPRAVLVIGGGEGATLREILRHPSVERVVMVDIDAELVDLCERFLPEWHHGAFEDPRVDLVLEEGEKYVSTTREQFDAVFVDICDPLAEDPKSLYAIDFYEKLQQCLSPSGIIVAQTQECPNHVRSEHLRVYQNLRQVFSFVNSYRSYMTSFLSVWGFLVANNIRSIADDIAIDIDRVLSYRGINRQLRYYDGETHRHMFSLSKDFRKILGAQS